MMVGVTGKGWKMQQLVGVVVLLLSAVVQLSSTAAQDCSVERKTMQITDQGTGYFRTNKDKVQIKVHAKDAKKCKVFYFLYGISNPTDPEIVTYDIDVSELKPTHLNVKTLVGTTRTKQWYEISFLHCYKLLILNIGKKITHLALDNTTYLQVQELSSPFESSRYLTMSSPRLNFPNCYPTYLDISIKNAEIMCPQVPNLMYLKQSCSSMESLPHLHVNKSVSQTSTNPLDKRTSSIPIPTPYHPTTYIENHGTYDYGSRGEENAIPIFIGVLAFTLSMCMRFCLCRGKSVVQRVTTVTVIRSRPATEIQEENQHDAALDPPPAYVDVVNENQTTQTPQEPPPPAYSDIDPPPYYELEVPTGSESESTARQDSTPQAVIPKNNEAPEETPATTTSSFARAIQSRARTHLKQFAFKPLEEEEEEEQEQKDD